ncbi:hypothetical protein OSB04_012066 [Centaurea solstitialis]|uniref:Uncharacterized protein n=1 Tax=Centaurea solstitialis TaxID=347529 RepID=A0AA38WDL9_9ASTR|nr:hypothetical protein OSB04_012066 [Centaurea solstitialis]
MLKNYLLELKRTNPDAMLKLDRELLGLDRWFMKGSYPGQIITLVGVDQNHGTYPLAYAIVKAEKSLKDDLGLQRNSDFTFIRDRQKGIVPTIVDVFPREHETYLEGDFKDHLWKCAATSTVQLFNKAMDDFKAFHEATHAWLKQIPPQNWSKGHFSFIGRCHSDIVLNNICGVFNGQLVYSRYKPIITALDYIRQYLMKNVLNVQRVIAKYDGPLTLVATKMFGKIKEETVEYNVIWNGGNKYEMIGPFQDQVIVDVQVKSCFYRH